MKTKALGIVCARLLAALAVVPAAGGVSPRLKRCDSSNFPNALVWLRVEGTGCATGKETTRLMRAYMRDNPGAGGKNGWFRHRINGWKCKARFVGGDEVIERCRRARAGSAGSSLIRALFYID